MRRRFWVLSFGLLGLSSCQSAPSGGYDAALSMAVDTLGTLTGRCERFVLGGRDLTSGCQPVLATNNLPPDRVQFHFSFSNSAVITLSGRDLPNPTPDTDVIALDRVLVNLNIPGVPPTNGSANGRCTFANPFKGPMIVRCTGTSDVGSINVAFRTDGRPPRG